MDFKLVENGNGGDLVKTAKDIATIYGWENMPYLAMFAGNPGRSTPLERLTTEQGFDWWGNSLLHPNDPGVQFNSETEYILNITPLNSEGRVAIQEAVKRDLAFMKSFAKVSVAVSITGVDRVLIGIRIQEPDNLEQRDFLFLWDATKKELLLSESKPPSGGVTPPPPSEGFDYVLDFILV